MRRAKIAGPTEQMLQAHGRLAGFRHRIEGLRQRLEGLALWRPAVGLARQAQEAARLVEGIQQRLEKKLVVTLIGPCGSGKSTLLNALAGVDDLSPTGIDRPTTRQVVIFGKDSADIDAFAALYPELPVRMKTAESARSLDHLLLVDTPDTDSSEAESYRSVVDAVVSASDVLLCVFDAENPKRRDHVDFLAPYVQRFDGDSLAAVLNRCDRLDEEEIKDRIVPEFSAYLHSAWARPVDTLLCISARSHLAAPGWDPSATPRHGFDQFEQLHELIFGAFNRPGFVVDRRLENAGRLCWYIEAQVRTAVGRHRPAIVDAGRLILDAEKRAAEAGFEALEQEVADAQTEIHTALYRRLAQRWVGPVGWMTATWARLLSFGSGVSAFLRGGGTSLLSLAAGGRRSSRSGGESPFPGALKSVRSVLARDWPAIAEALVKGGFEPSVRRIEDVLPGLGDRLRSLSDRWEEALSTEIDRAAAALSHPLLQLLFNLPIVAVLLHAGWRTVADYFSGNVLPVAFFLHTLLMVGIALVLTFFLLQTLIRLIAGQRRILKRTLKRALGSSAELRPLTESEIGARIEAFFALEAMVAEEGEKSPEEVVDR
ncbi:MAG: 50S ribosome-binding GTPase [Desulfobacterales bacterium]|nr:50S ribosome-binding GTPase [Desulfobacterales bacterium]